MTRVTYRVSDVIDVAADPRRHDRQIIDVDVTYP